MKTNLPPTWITTLTLLAVLFVANAPTATAAERGHQPDLEKLAIKQSQLLYEFHRDPLQVASPRHCGQGQPIDGVDGVFILPTLSFVGGNKAFKCTTNAKAVLVDLGGYTVIEDPRFPDSAYPLAGVDEPGIAFSKENLQSICADVISLTQLGVAPAHLDGGAALTTNPITTRNFGVRINRLADPAGQPFYADSVALGHPGRLTSCYAGYKAIVQLSPGHHVIDVNLSGLTGTPTSFVYNIYVRGHR